MAVETDARSRAPLKAGPAAGEGAVVGILAALSFSHLLNDTISSLVIAIYPILKNSFHLDFGQIGLITATHQLTASLLQPLVGLFTDHRPKPYSVAVGMGFTLLGLLLLSQAATFPLLLVSTALVGMGSAIFHPESSRVARLASGGRHGMAQSVFQVGGNVGSALGPLLAAFVVLPHGQKSIAWFSLLALLAMVVLSGVGRWYKQHRAEAARAKRPPVAHGGPLLTSRQIGLSLAVLIALIFSKFFYLASLTSYYTFYLIEKFALSVRDAQLHLFVFLAAVAVGTVVGGPIGDRIGRRRVIWVSILGALPFTLLLPYADLFWTTILSVMIGLVISSAFAAIVVYAQELVPGKVGMVSGLFFGLAFGMGGIGAAVLGEVADLTSIGFVYRIVAFLPALGLLTGFLPELERRGVRR
jgi:MFS transporter, FSR family, fosmidomycin resistance protein